MLLKKDTYAYNQIMFGVLALDRMFEREVLDDALAQTTLSEAYEKLSKYMPSKDQYLLDSSSIISSSLKMIPKEYWKHITPLPI